MEFTSPTIIVRDLKGLDQIEGPACVREQD